MLLHNSCTNRYRGAALKGPLPGQPLKYFSQNFSISTLKDIPGNAVHLGWYGMKIERKKLRHGIKKMSEETLESKYFFHSLFDAEVQRLRVRDSLVQLYN